MLDADADEWPERLAAAFNCETPVLKRHVLAIVQAQIERVVLLAENGSFQQRVQAEFLRELVRLAEVEAPASPDDDAAAAFDPVQAILDADLGEPSA